MKLLMSTYRSDEDDEAGHYALVFIDEDLAKEILRGKELFQMVHSREKSVNTICFWDPPCVFYSSYAGESVEDRLTKEQVQELVDGEGFVEVPDDFEIDEEYETRTDCDQLVISEEHFYWKASCRYTSRTYESHGVSYDVLLPLLQKEKKKE